jgi:hypothetical protein
LATRHSSRLVLACDSWFPSSLLIALLEFAGPEETTNLAGKCPPPDSDSV